MKNIYEKLFHLNYIFNEDDARKEKENIDKKYDEEKSKIKKYTIIENILWILLIACFIGLAGCMISLFIIQPTQLNVVYKTILCVPILGILALIPFVIKYGNRLDFLINTKASDSYSLKENFFKLINDKNKRIIYAMITLPEKDVATLHIFYNENDDKYGEVVKFFMWKGIEIVKDKNIKENYLDINNEIYYIK